MITAVAADTELSQWLASEYIHCSLGVAIPWAWHRKWSVRIDSAVGKPFLSAWKAHLLTLAVRLPAAVVDTNDNRAPAAKKPRIQRGTKRQRSDAPPPPSGSKRARLERLQAAKASLAASSSAPALTVASTTSSSSSSLLAGGEPVGVPSRAGLAMPGAIT